MPTTYQPSPVLTLAQRESGIRALISSSFSFSLKSFSILSDILSKNLPSFKGAFSETAGRGRNHFTEIKKVLDDRYVLQSDCNDRQENVNKKFSKDDKRIELLVHDFKVIKWLITTVAVSSISVLVVSFFELILK